MIQFKLPNGEVVPVPQEIQGAGDAAVQGFYDGQAERVAGELKMSVADLHARAFSDAVEAKAAGKTPEAFRAAADELRKSLYAGVSQ